MTAKSTWMPMLADAYANKYGEVAQDFLSLVVEPSLAALEQKKAEIAAQSDQALAAFHLYDHHQLISKTRMALCLGVQSLWEQQLRSYLGNCVVRGDDATKMDKIQTASWDHWRKDLSLKHLFTEIRGLELESFESYKRLDILQLLGNVCRHGPGPSSVTLIKRYPELWPETGAQNKQFGAPVDGSLITDALIRDLVNAVVLFWLDMRIACTEALIPNNAAMIGEVVRLRVKRKPLM